MSLNRRHFLKSAALGGGGLVAGAVGVNAITPWVWPVPFLNSGFDYVPNEPFRWAAAKTGVLWYALTDRE